MFSKSYPNSMILTFVIELNIPSGHGVTVYRRNIVAKFKLVDFCNLIISKLLERYQ